jgi:hypothetical protein
MQNKHQNNFCMIPNGSLRSFERYGPQPKELPKGCVDPKQADDTHCDKIQSGSKFNTGSYRCDIKPSCATNYTYNSETGKCKLNAGTKSTTKMEDNISPTCPTKFQLNNLSMCETTDDNKPRTQTCTDSSYTYNYSLDACCPPKPKK